VSDCRSYTVRAGVTPAVFVCCPNTRRTSWRASGVCHGTQTVCGPDPCHNARRWHTSFDKTDGRSVALYTACTFNWWHSGILRADRHFTRHETVVQVLSAGCAVRNGRLPRQQRPAIST